MPPAYTTPYDPALELRHTDSPAPASNPFTISDLIQARDTSSPTSIYTPITTAIPMTTDYSLPEPTFTVFLAPFPDPTKIPKTGISNERFFSNVQIAAIVAGSVLAVFIAIAVIYCVRAVKGWQSFVLQRRESKGNL